MIILKCRDKYRNYDNHNSTNADKGVNPVHSGNDLVDTQIRICPEIVIRIRSRIPDHFWLGNRSSKGQVHLALMEVCTLRVLSSSVCSVSISYVCV